MEKYTLYIAKNIFQLRKSQVNIKLDRDLQNMAKKHVMEVNLLDDENVNFENKAKNLEVKDENDINISTTDLYLYVFTQLHANTRTSKKLLIIWNLLFYLIDIIFYMLLII